MSSTMEFLIRARDAGGTRAIDEFAGHAEQAGQRVGSSWKKVGGLLAGAFAVDKVKDFLGDSIAEATEAQKVGAQTAAVLKSTKGEANLTATAIGNLATKISNKVGIDDEAIQSGENLLLTFTNIKNEAGAGNDIFSQTTQIMTDMSVATGTDMKTSAIQLGKALNDPIKGVSALTKVGVSFTAQQKDQIAALVKTGDTMGAQKIILGELNKEFGGSAAAQVTPAEKAAVAWGNLKEQIGDELLPVIGKLATFATDDLVPALSSTVSWIQKNEEWIKPLAIAVGTLWAAWKLHTIATDAMAAVNTKMATLRTQFGSTATVAGTSSASVAEAEARQTAAITEGSSAQVAAIRRVQLAQEQAATTATETAAVQGRAAAGAGLGAAGGVGAAGVASRLGKGVRVGAGLAIGGYVAGQVVGAGASKTSGRAVAGSTLQGAGIGAGIGATVGSVVPGLGTAVGAAVGGAVGGVYSFTKSFIGLRKAQDDAKASSNTFVQAVKNEGQTVQAYATNILAGGKAVKDNQIATAAAAATRSGLTAQAAAAGLTERDLANAITGSSAAYNKVVDAWKAGANPSQTSLNALDRLRDQFGKGATAAGLFADQQGVALASEQRTGTATDLLTGKLGNFNRTGATAQGAASLFKSSLDSLTTSVGANGTTLDANTSFGRSNIAAIRTAAAQALAHAQAVYQQTGSLKEADKALQTDRTQLVQTATRAGLTKTEVKKLADSIANIPANKKSKVTVDTAGAYRAVTSFSSWYLTTLSQLVGTIPAPRYAGGVTATVPVKAGGVATGGGLIGVPAGNTKHNAQGTGYWRGGRTMVGEFGPEILDVPTGSAITPNTAAASQGAFGGGADIQVHVHVNGQVYGSVQELGRTVIGALEQVVGRGGTLNIGRGVR